MKLTEHNVELASPPGFMEAAVAAAVVVVLGIAVYWFVRRN